MEPLVSPTPDAWPDQAALPTVAAQARPVHFRTVAAA